MFGWNLARRVPLISNMEQYGAISSCFLEISMISKHENSKQQAIFIAKPSA
jgi:hypothetical protein